MAHMCAKDPQKVKNNAIERNLESSCRNGIFVNNLSLNQE